MFISVVFNSELTDTHQRFGDSDDDTISICHEDKQRLFVISLLVHTSNLRVDY